MQADALLLMAVWETFLQLAAPLYPALEVKIQAMLDQALAFDNCGWSL